MQLLLFHAWLSPFPHGSCVEPERKGLMAAVIKNADRLGMLKGVTSGKVTPELVVISDALYKIVEARNESKSRNTRPAIRSQPPAVPAMPLSYGR